MTKINLEIETEMPLEAVLPISTDVSFISNSFSKYKLRVDHLIYQDHVEDNHNPSLKDIVEREASNLSDWSKCIFVGDLANKFDKNFIGTRFVHTLKRF